MAAQAFWHSCLKQISLCQEYRWVNKIHRCQAKKDSSYNQKDNIDFLLINKNKHGNVLNEDELCKSNIFSINLLPEQQTALANGQHPFEQRVSFGLQVWLKTDEASVTIVNMIVKIKNFILLRSIFSNRFILRLMLSFIYEFNFRQ